MVWVCAPVQWVEELEERVEVAVRDALERVVQVVVPLHYHLEKPADGFSVS